MPIWDTAAVNPAAGIEGLLIDQSENGTDSYVAENAVRAGFLVQYGTDIATTRRQVTPITAAPVADINALVTNAVMASAVAPVVLETAAEFDGVIGLERIYPPRAVTIDTDADAGWDGPLGFIEFTIYGEDADGAPVSDRLIRNNIGAVAWQGETRQCFSRVRQIDVPGSNAATGTGQAGVTPNLVEWGKLDSPGIVCYDVAREPSAVAAVTFDAGETLCCVREGRIWAVAVDAVVPGDIVTVRVQAGGGGLGSLSGTEAFPSGGNFAKLLNARWMTAAAAGGLAIIELS